MQQLILESGLYFEAPEGFFRWQDGQYFIDHFKRFGVQEMDFGWWDPKARVMNLLELKDYSCPGKDELPIMLIDKLTQKATDCILLLASVWHDLPHARGIREGLTKEWHERPGLNALRLHFVLKLANRSDIVALQSMRDSLENRLRGRLEIFDLRASTKVLLMDHWTAQEMGLPLQEIIEADAPLGRASRKRGRRPREA